VIAIRVLFVYTVFCLAFVSADNDTPEILRISPTSGPEGTRVEITGRNLQSVTAVFFGANNSSFKLISPEKLITIVPHRALTETITVSPEQAHASSPFPFVVVNDPRVPEEVSYKAGYVNPDHAPPGFSSVMLWGIAIADTRVSGYESAMVEVARTQLACRVDGKEIILNEDAGKLHGGLYRRKPWFAGNQSEPMPFSYDTAKPAVILRVGQRPDRVWHFWSASPRPTIPYGKLEGCTVKALVRISQGALLQMGMDYWRNSTVPFAPGNNHEAGASNWYFPSGRWQEAMFSDIGGPTF
jgi:IPT/TIG domain